jgi:malonate transporter MadL subunit
MVIYGVALLSACLLAGAFLGDLLGELIGVEANVGGVGIAMLLLILVSDRLRSMGRLNPTSTQGILFWSSIYIPVVVAMAAKQDVLSALKGGPAAVLAGTLAVGLGFLLVPVIVRLGAARGPDGGDSAAGDDR